MIYVNRVGLDWIRLDWMGFYLMKDNRRLGGSEDKYDFKTEARIKGK